MLYLIFYSTKVYGLQILLGNYCKMQKKIINNVENHELLIRMRKEIKKTLRNSAKCAKRIIMSIKSGSLSYFLDEPNILN